VADQGWYETVLRDLLSQGDIFDSFPFSSPSLPLTHLSKGTGKGGVIWTPSAPKNPLPQGHVNHALFAYRLAHAIVISHDCAIDKSSAGNARILFAPVAPLTVFDPATQEAIRRQAHLAAMLLPDVPGLGDSYIDLKAMTPFPLELVLQRTKVASLTDKARDRLQQALVAFLVYRQKPAAGE
jgi:hypothetical protein